MHPLVLAVVIGVPLLLVLLRPARRALRVTATLDRPLVQVWRLHVEPRHFYAVLRHSDDALNKHYDVVDERRTPTSIDYTLEHRTRFGIVRSRPRRFAIDERARSFEETFTALSTTFHFRWQMHPLPSSMSSSSSSSSSSSVTATAIQLDVTLTGPWLLCWFFRRVRSDFERRFRIERKFDAQVFANVPSE